MAFLLLNCKCSLHFLWYLSSIMKCVICKFLYSLRWLAVHFLNDILWSTKVLVLVSTAYLLFFFCNLCLWCHIYETIAQSNIMKILMVSSKGFIVVAPSIYGSDPFWAFCMCVWYKEGTQLFLLYVNTQLSQHCLLKRLVFSPLNYLGTFVKDHLTLKINFYFWILSSTSLICMPT